MVANDVAVGLVACSITAGSPTLRSILRNLLYKVIIELGVNPDIRMIVMSPECRRIAQT